jgi:hypothetical protein
MGIFDNLLGNASELSNNDLQTELAPPARGCASPQKAGQAVRSIRNRPRFLIAAQPITSSDKTSEK